MSRIDRAGFIARAVEFHGEWYDYSRVKYLGWREPVELVCPIHGSFWQRPQQHALRGSGCRACSDESRASARRRSTEDFIRAARMAHGSHYDYSLTEYRGAKHAVTVVCPEHGPFDQVAGNHERGHGCPYCAIEERADRTRLGTRSFIRRAVEAHGTRYDYTAVSYADIFTPVIIVCCIHGSFAQKPVVHLRGGGCPACAQAERAQARRVGRLEFIHRAHQVHGDRYDYSEMRVGLVTEPSRIICPTHGHFTQKPHSHLSGAGCRACGRQDAIAQRTGTTSEFVERAIARHGRVYDYSEVTYSTAQTPVRIICPDHGPFLQSPQAHLRGAGCPLEAGSSAEGIAWTVLNRLGLECVREWTVTDLTSDKGYPLRFDFAVPSSRLVIELDGAHHRHPVNFGGMSDAAATQAHKRTVMHDQLKNEWVAVNGWRLVRIADDTPSLSDRLHIAITEALACDLPWQRPWWPNSADPVSSPRECAAWTAD